jgi:hypothetical protein
MSKYKTDINNKLNEGKVKLPLQKKKYKIKTYKFDERESKSKFYHTKQY